MEGRKRKKSECKEQLQNGLSFEEEIKSSHKKKRIKNVMKEEQYKPGMLSDLLQKQKFGHLILPWETSFGEEHSENDMKLDNGETKKDEPHLKINPLFDKSKRSGENIAASGNNSYTVFVGNLPHEITISQVKKIFKKFRNTITKIKIRSGGGKANKPSTTSTQSVNTDNGSKHVIVKFNSEESYNSALKMSGKLLNGHRLRITCAKNETKIDPTKSIFVGNLVVGTSDDDLWKTFEKCGEIDSVRVIRDRLNKKGIFGYVNFKSADSAVEAMKLDGTNVLDREIRVSQIHKNVDSLSNSLTVKRKKMKKTKILTTHNSESQSKSNSLSNPLTVKKRKKKKKQNLSVNPSVENPSLI